MSPDSKGGMLLHLHPITLLLQLRLLDTGSANRIAEAVAEETGSRQERRCRGHHGLGCIMHG